VRLGTADAIEAGIRGHAALWQIRKPGTNAPTQLQQCAPDGRLQRGTPYSEAQVLTNKP